MAKNAAVRRKEIGITQSADDLILSFGEDPIRLLEIAEGMASDGDLDRVLRLTSYVIARDPGNAGAYNIAGCAYFSHCMPDQALEHFRTAHDMDPSDLDIGKNYIDSCIAMCHHEEATSACEELLTLFPSDSELIETRRTLVDPPAVAQEDTYSSRVEREIKNYTKVEKAEQLPKIFGYWAQKHLSPKVEEIFGTRSIASFFANSLAQALTTTTDTRDLLSIGCGDCSLEISIAKELVSAGFDDFSLECADVSPVRLEQAQKAIVDSGLEHRVVPIVRDLNKWVPDKPYAGVMANHSLHHLVELERIFAGVRACLPESGVFVINDMIGRNGHMRWPEALEVVDALWRLLPESHRYNHLLKRVEEAYENWDCSVSGFEGIRAQDILPLLTQDFHFERFLAFGNLTDLFVDRCFGHSFSPDNEFDTAFIDLAEKLNAVLIDLGYLKPTMMLAVLRTVECPLTCHRSWTPEFCIRQPL